MLFEIEIYFIFVVMIRGGKMQPVCFYLFCVPEE